MSHSEEILRHPIKSSINTEFNVQGQIQLMLILDKLPRRSLCVDTIGPYNTYERLVKIGHIIKSVYTKPTIREGLYNAPQTNDDFEHSRFFIHI